MKKLVRESLNEVKKLLKKNLGKTFKENDPFLDELYEAIETRFGDNYAQNYELNIDFEGDEDDEINLMIVTEEYNVYWTDREERHPWVEIKTIVDFIDKTIITTGNLSSKEGDIDVDEDSKNSFDEFDAEEIANSIWDNVDEVTHNLEFASKQ